MTFRNASGWLVVSGSTGPVPVASMVNRRIVAMSAELVFQSAWIRFCWSMDLSSNVNPGLVGLSRSVLKNVLC